MAVKASGSITLSSVVDVKAVYRYYLLQSSTLAKPSKPATNPPSSSWDDVEPTYTEGSTNTLYTVDLTVFSDDTWSYSEVSISSSYEAAKSAYNKAVNAQNTANGAKNDIDNLEIGGANLIQKRLIYWGNMHNLDIVSTNYIHVTHVAEGNTSAIMFGRTYEPGTYTLNVKGSVSSTLWILSSLQLTSKFITNAYYETTYGAKYHLRTPTYPFTFTATEPFVLGILLPTEYGVQDISGLKLEKGNRATDWSPAPEDMVSVEDLDALEIGGTNLISKHAIVNNLVTADMVSTNHIDISGIDQWNCSVLIIERTYEPGTYTLNITGSVSGKAFQLLSNVQIDSDFKTNSYYSSLGVGYVKDCTFPLTLTVAEEFKLGFVMRYDVGEQTISELKLEKGEKPTTWSPAPEDLATSDDVSNAQSSATEALERVAVAESVIQTINKVISMMVTDGTGASLMTQTEDGWTFSTVDLQEALDSVSENLDIMTNEVGEVTNTVDILRQAVDDLGVIGEYVKITIYEDEPCIELGEADSDFKLRITNTRMMFMDGENVVAYFNNQSMHIKKAVIEEELQQGDFVWKVRSNGNLGLIWKGAST